MRAVLTTDHGDLSKLQYVEDYPMPTPEEDEAVIKIAACSLNFHDIFTRRGMPGIKIGLPVVVGSDISGEVTETGSDDTAHWIGKRVLLDPVFRDGKRAGMIGETVDGGRAEYVAVPAANLVEIPDNVSFEDAAALPLAYGTAWRMMVTIANVSAGERVLILGASGGVGVACVQIAKMKGAEVVACASSQSKLDRLKEIGADHVVDYTSTSYLDAIKEIYGKPRLDGSGGVDLAVNFTGGDTMKETQRCVKLHGRIVTCGATAGYNVEIDARFWWSYEHKMLGSNGWMPEDLETLLAFISEGKMRPIIDKVLPLEETAEAERIIEDREVLGKILVKP